MPNREALETLLLDNLRHVERIAASLCRRHHLGDADADDFGSWVKLKLVEGDYAVLGKFRDESAMTTYLTVVVAMLFRDYRVRHWGRWRPSAAALREGRVAVRLETLVHRYGYRLDQAAEILRTSGETQSSDRELWALLARLPARSPSRPVEVEDDPLEGTPAPSHADDRVLDREADAQHRVADEALTRALTHLPPEDQVILRMRFWEGMSVANIARGLKLERKPLTPRIVRDLTRLRGDLEEAGITRDDVRSLLEDAAS